MSREGAGGRQSGLSDRNLSLEAAFWEPSPFPGGCKFRREVSFLKNPILERERYPGAKSGYSGDRARDRVESEVCGGTR